MTVYVLCVARLNTREYSTACSSCSSNSLPAYSTSSSLSSSALLVTGHPAPSRTWSEPRADPRWPVHQIQVCSIVLAVVCSHSFARHCPDVAHRKSRSVQAHSGLVVCPSFIHIRRSPVFFLCRPERRTHAPDQPLWLPPPRRPRASKEGRKSHSISFPLA